MIPKVPGSCVIAAADGGSVQGTATSVYMAGTFSGSVCGGPVGGGVVGSVRMFLNGGVFQSHVGAIGEGKSSVLGDTSVILSGDTVEVLGSSFVSSGSDADSLVKGNSALELRDMTPAGKMSAFQGTLSGGIAWRVSARFSLTMFNFLLLGGSYMVLMW